MSEALFIGSRRGAESAEVRRSLCSGPSAASAPLREIHSALRAGVVL
jgi:hypothetical protein